MLAKKFLLKVDEDTFYDEHGNKFWFAQYDLPCCHCKKQPAYYFTTKGTARFCDNCVIVLSLREVFEAQMEVVKRKEKAIELEGRAAKRLEEEQRAALQTKHDKIELEADLLYTTFMDYHEINNQYIRPAWKDAIGSNKDHFYYMAEQIVDLREQSNEIYLREQSNESEM